MKLTGSQNRTVTKGREIIHMYYYLNILHELKILDMWKACKQYQRDPELIK